MTYFKEKIDLGPETCSCFTNTSCFKWLRLVNQYGRHAHYVVKKKQNKKTLKNLLLRNEESYEAESWYKASGTQGLSNFVQMIVVG